MHGSICIYPQFPVNDAARCRAIFLINDIPSKVNRGIANIFNRSQTVKGVIGRSVRRSSGRRSGVAVQAVDYWQ